MVVLLESLLAEVATIMFPVGFVVIFLISPVAIVPPVVFPLAIAPLIIISAAPVPLLVAITILIGKRLPKSPLSTTGLVERYA